VSNERAVILERTARRERLTTGTVLITSRPSLGLLPEWEYSSSSMQTSACGDRKWCLTRARKLTFPQPN